MSPPAETDIVLFTYNGDLEWPVDYQQEDGYEFYTWLLDQGYTSITGHPQWDLPDLSVSYFQNFDLILYWNSYGHGAGNAVASGVPFITVSAMHAPTMNLGGSQTMHEYRDAFCIVNHNYYPTEPYDIGPIYFEEGMWTDGVQASGEGVALIRDTCDPTAARATTWSSIKGLYH